MKLLNRLLRLLKRRGLVGAILRVLLFYPVFDELRWRAYCLFSFKRPVVKNILGNMMKVEPFLGGLHKELFLYGCREMESTAVFSAMIPEGAIVADIGANIGYYTLIEAKAARKIYAFEPSPVNIDLLRENIAVNGCGDRVEVHELAFSDSIGRASFSTSEVPNHHRLLGAAEEKPKSWIEVRTCTVDEFFKQREVDVIRMDLEGAEWLVFRGMKNMIETSKRPLLIFMEVHGIYIKRYGGDARIMLDYLFEHGFRVCHIMLFGYKHGYSRAVRDYFMAEYCPHQYTPGTSKQATLQIMNYKELSHLIQNEDDYCLFMQR
jgi:FkbM family methyltransferase